MDQEGVSTDTRKTEQQLTEQTYEHNILWRDIEALFAEFIKKAKTNAIDDSELATKISSLDADENELQYRFSVMGSILLSAYENQYADYGAYDYEDMMLRAREIVQSNMNGERMGYRHILVDEFQDLNLVQVELLRAILNQTEDNHLFAVGDDWQSVYGFRGARPEFFVEFEERFSPAATTRLNTNYRCPPAVIDGSSAVMSESTVETTKSLEPADSTTEATPVVYKLSGQDGWEYETNVVRWAADRVEQSIDVDGYSPTEILVLARNKEGSPFVPRLASELEKRDISVNDGWDSVTITTAHGAKGSEADHVILLNVVENRDDGFPPEEQRSTLTEVVETGDEDHIAEERRLFYMALTRTKDRLDIQTRVGHESSFLSPLREYVTYESIPIDWEAERLSVQGRVTDTRGGFHTSTSLGHSKFRTREFLIL
jgi:Superfamily I DNA and RNA helicases